MLSHHKYFHWLYHHKNKKSLFNGATGLFIWFFLAFARPFGISNNNISLVELIAFLLPVGLLWILIVYSLDFLIRSFSISILLNIKGDLIAWGCKIFLYVHVIWIIRGYACDWTCLDTFEYLELWIGMILLIGLVYLPYSFYGRYSYYHIAISHGATDESVIVIKGDGNDFIKINPNEVMYIKADDNYIDCTLSTGEKVTLRSSLTSTYEQLAEQPQFIRTHRSYVINSQYFERYKKAQANILLKSKDQMVEVPVSRSYKEEIDKYFTHPK